MSIGGSIKKDQQYYRRPQTGRYFQIVNKCEAKNWRFSRSEFRNIRIFRGQMQVKSKET